MARNCLNCGSPLGSQAELCYTCQQDGIQLEDVLTINEDVRDRVERYFIIASIKCADCGSLHVEVEANGQTYTADDFAIETPSDWELEMEKEEDWVADNREAVSHALYALEDEWPQTTAAVRQTLL